MTIAIHLSGGGVLITATDTQMTYSSGDKVDSGKIISRWRANPSGSIMIAGAGDVLYMNALAQEIFNGFAAFQGVNQILQGDTRADKNGRAAHDFGIRVNDAFQIFDCHNMAKIPLPAELSPANRVVGRAPAGMPAPKCLG